MLLFIFKVRKNIITVSRKTIEIDVSVSNLHYDRRIIVHLRAAVTFVHIFYLCYSTNGMIFLVAIQVFIIQQTYHKIIWILNN